MKTSFINITQKVYIKKETLFDLFLVSVTSEYFCLHDLLNFKPIFIVLIFVFFFLKIFIGCNVSSTELCFVQNYIKIKLNKTEQGIFVIRALFICPALDFSCQLVGHLLCLLSNVNQSIKYKVYWFIHGVTIASDWAHEFIVCNISIFLTWVFNLIFDKTLIGLFFGMNFFRGFDFDQLLK